MSAPGPTQSRHTSKQDYQTPPAFLAAVRSKFGITDFICDLAASPQNAVVPYFITAEENSLTKAWATLPGLSWCNPPFANIAPWVRQAWEESQRGAHLVMLLPAGVGSNWWRDWVHGKAGVYLLNGRIGFVGTADAYPKDCVLLHYAPGVGPVYRVWTWPLDAPKVPR